MKRFAVFLTAGMLILSLAGRAGAETTLEKINRMSPERVPSP